MTKHVLLLLSAVCLIQCTQIKKTKSGVDYEMIETTHGEKLKMGDLIQIHFSCETDYDSLISSSTSVKKPLILQLNKDNGSEINEALSEFSVGDSAILYPNAAKFLSETMRRTDIPARIKSDSKLKFSVRIMKILNQDEIAKLKNKEDKIMAEKEKMLLEEYLQKEQITAQATRTGLYYIEKEKGTGRKIVENSKVKLAYRGYFINGLSFGSDDKNGEIIEVDLSEHRVILGWEEGLLKMSKGTKAKLIIPSQLAYGANGMKPNVPPFSTLIFEIDVIDVK